MFFRLLNQWQRWPQCLCRILVRSSTLPTTAFLTFCQRSTRLQRLRRFSVLQTQVRMNTRSQSRKAWRLSPNQFQARSTLSVVVALEQLRSVTVINADRDVARAAWAVMEDLLTVRVVTTV